MARPSKEEILQKIHSEALGEFDLVQSAYRDERLQCLQDRRFYSIAGAQWEGPLGQQFENRPRVEVNKIHLAVIRIINEYRNNSINVSFVSRDGDENDALADTCCALYRADEQDSLAEEAYDNAFEEGASGGIGAWRLRAEYEDDEDDEDDRQRIRFEPIYDADSSVYFDLNAKRQDKSDATKCWVLSSMSHQSFIDEWGVDPASWPKQVFQRQFDWLTPNVVFVAEYYVVESTNETIYIYRGLGGKDEQRIHEDEFEENPDLEEQLAVTGFTLSRKKKIKRRRVHKYIMCGNKVLEDCGYIAGRYIPIIPVYGKRWFVDNVERCMGHVRLAKDAQRLKNMQLSQLAVISAMSPYRKPIFTPEQVAGHQMAWAEDNVKNFPYLLINQLTGPDGQPVAIGPQSYVEPPEVPPAMAALLQITELDMQDLLGNQQAGEEITPNTSGVAVELIQNKLDMQSFIYMSNMAKAKRWSATVWLSMAKELYVEEGRTMKGVGNQNEITQIKLNTPTANPETAEVYNENDLEDAKLDTVVDLGPNSSSRRQSTVRSLTGMMTMTQDPNTLQVLTAAAMMNMEGEGLTDIRDYFRKTLVQQGVVKPTPEEAQQMTAQQQNRQPDPDVVLANALADESRAKAALANANTVLAVAKTEETKANAGKIVAGIHRDDSKHVVDAVTQLAALHQDNGDHPADSNRVS